MHLKVPPVAVFGVAVLLLYAGKQLFPALTVILPGKGLLAILFAFAGALCGGPAVRSFLKNETTVNPTAPEKASTLVTGGLYRMSRNPMYLGLLLWLIAVAIHFGSLSALAVVPAFIWYMTEFQIKPEETRLSENFGQAYEDYLDSVRRWI